MEVCNILGVDIYVCADSAEARKVWKEHPKDRHRIWEVMETWAHCLDTPEQLQAVLDRKLKKPGRVE